MSDNNLYIDPKRAAPESLDAVNRRAFFGARDIRASDSKAVFSGLDIPANDSFGARSYDIDNRLDIDADKDDNLSNYIADSDDDSDYDGDTGAVSRNIITTYKLSKTFSTSGVQVHVLRNLDMDIKQGDFTIVMGTSGSGKSTLLYALSGIDTPTLGAVMFAGSKISAKTSEELALFRRKHCGFVFQQIYLCNNMSLIDNVMASGLLVNKSRKTVANRAKYLFGQVGLGRTEWQKFPPQVSGGEAQRAAIVRALINDPQVIFADEPTGSLNSSSSFAVLNLLTRANRNGQSIVMVTHDLTTALRGNRVLYLKDGVIAGQCDLGKYGEEGSDDSGRRKILHNLLDKMGW